MRTLVVCLAMACCIAAQNPTAAPTPTKEDLRKQIAELKVKAFEIQTQVELLEAQLRDIERAEELKPLPLAAKTPPAKVRCAGHTKDGKRCSRHAEAGSRYCWQHKQRH
ncbi:MAG: hypothetical protein NW208_18980 [Bryobacter sp.]|nr:hypothetical protein [Bryobacter sp.]